MTAWTLGVIGGSGLYEIDGLQDRKVLKIDTPWGAPSDDLVCGTLNGAGVVFLPRHGKGHRISPTHLNFRANIAALKMAGCSDLLSVSAVGSLREDLTPGTFVIVDQFVDRTFARDKSFFEPGLVAHVSMADPTCPRLSQLAFEAARRVGGDTVLGGVYLVMEGPQFSTRAESRLYRAWGCDVIGMTNMPEAKLAREAELPYASVAMVTDYDSWRDGEGAHVDVDQIVACMRDNANRARALIKTLTAALDPARAPSPIDRALDGAIITGAEGRDPAVLARLSALAGRPLS